MATVTVTVAAAPTFSPPRNAITLTADTGYILQSGTLYRVQSGVRTATRTQPIMGQSTQIVYDYETPYGSPVTYEYVGTVSPSGPLTEWDETWANTTAWSVAGGTASVSGGILSLTESGSVNVRLTRSLAGNSGCRVTGNSMSPGSQLVLDWVTTTNAQGVGVSTAQLIVSVSSSGVVSVQLESQSASFFTVASAATHTIQLDVVGDGVTVTVDGTAQKLTRTSLSNPDHVELRGPTGTWGGEVIAAAYATSATSVDVTSSQVTNTPASGWLVHPLVPALSVPVSTTDRTLVGVTSIGDRYRVSTATLHPILGQSLPILSTTGPRQAAAFVLTLAARNVTQSAQLEALINDQTPLLIQFPQGSIDEWTPGFYAVIPTTAAGSTDASFGRFAQNTVVPRRVVTWPLQQVQPPIGGVANPGWSWNSVAAKYATWNDVANAYATWADLAANNVRS